MVGGCCGICTGIKDNQPPITKKILAGRTKRQRENISQGPYDKGKKYCKNCRLWMYVEEKIFLDSLPTVQQGWVERQHCPCCHAKLRHSRHSHRKTMKYKRHLPVDNIVKKEIISYTKYDHGSMACAECKSSFAVYDKHGTSKQKLMSIKFIQGFKRYYHLECGRLLRVGL